MSKEIFSPKLITTIKDGSLRANFLGDIWAGVVVGIVALPLAIAFAVASGVPPQMGLVSAIIAGFLVSLLGGSRVQIAGPTGAFVVILYALVERYGLEGLAISTIMAGVLLVIFGLLRLGSLLKYFPYPLVVGFTSGIAVVIFSTQVKDALGLDLAKLPADFLDKWILYFSQLSSTNPYALTITIATILMVIYSKHITTKIPGSFFAIIFATLAVEFLDLPVATIETYFGEIPNDFSFSLPSFELANLSIYIVPAFTIALLGAIESLLSAVVTDSMTSTAHRSNTELIAQGIANIITPLFGGIAATGAIARSATNVKNGAKTPLAGIVHAITLLLIMLIFASYAKLIPMAALSGILIVVAYNMSEYKNFISVLRSSFFDSIILLSVFLLTIFVDLSVAIQVGVVLSALLFMKRMADIDPHEIDEEYLEIYSDLPEEIAIFEIKGPLFFASAKQYAQTIEHIGHKSKFLIIRMRYVSFMDLTAINNLRDAIKTLQNSGTTIFMSGTNARVFRDLRRHSIVGMIGEEFMFKRFEKALCVAKDALLAEETHEV
ncbi:MAG: SulP family inorganic anion transporter [Sulfuricurvum sp.]